MDGPPRAKKLKERVTDEFGHSMNDTDDDYSDSEATILAAFAAAEASFEKHRRKKQSQLDIASSIVRDTGCLKQYIVSHELITCNPSLLKSRQWLSACVLDLFGQILEHENSSVQYINIGFVDSYYDRIHPQWLRMLRTESRFILIPMNTENQHWTLAVVDREMQSIMHYDSISGYSNSERTTNILQKIENHISTLGGAPRNRRWSLNPAVECPRQSNGADCGAFVCYFMHIFATTPESAIQMLHPGVNVDVIKFRHKIFEIISVYEVKAT
jgi:hypothetical protein